MKSLAFVALGLMSLVSCDSDSGSGPSTGTSSTTLQNTLDPAPCLATFTKDFPVVDFFGDALFTAKKGESFVMESKPGRFFDKASLYKEIGTGFISFDVEDKGEGYPFESSCDTEKADYMYATFSKTDFYSDAKAKTKVCTLEAGTIVSKGGGGISLESGGFGDEPAIYELLVKVDQEGCEEAKYFIASETEAFGTLYTMMPVGSYLVAGE